MITAGAVDRTSIAVGRKAGKILSAVRASHVFQEYGGHFLGVEDTRNPENQDECPRCDEHLDSECENRAELINIRFRFETSIEPEAAGCENAGDDQQAGEPDQFVLHRRRSKFIRYSPEGVGVDC